MQKIVVANDKMQNDYSYKLTAPVGKNFDFDFKPELTPQEMLELGVFGGKYMTDCQAEFPKSWFKKAKLSPLKYNAKLNYFGVGASQPLKEWQRKGWIYKEDPRGWFQWYCRYYLGRRIASEDYRQIKRWKAMTRHTKALEHSCEKGDLSCRPRQRQAILHWAYDARKL